MKTKLFKYLLAPILFGLIISCSSSDDGLTFNGGANFQQILNISNTAQSGTWRVVSFLEDGVDETDNFFGYTFTFNSNGTVSAETLNDSKAGTWSLSNSSTSSDTVDFNLFFNVPANDDFEDLNDDWDVKSLESNRIELEDISGGNGGVDNLVFMKN